MVHFILGWNKQPYFKSRDQVHKIFFSIIIPARNEEAKIEACLDSIFNQAYPETLFEVIVVDDSSDDRTPEIIKTYQQHRKSLFIVPLEKIENREFVAYKKRALEAGIKQAQGSWVITTDADCIRNINWLSTFSSFINEFEPKFISAPVLFFHEDRFFKKLQSLEFMGLIGIGAASIAHQSPNMCNGANLAFEKDAFEKSGGYDGIDRIASGDDELLMHKIHDAYPGKVRFLKNAEAIVYTEPAKTLHDFIMQRKRWVSKSRKYERSGITLTLVLCYLFHLVIVINLLLCLLGYLPVIWFLLPCFVKMITEFLFLNMLSRFFNKKKLLLYYFPAFIPHILYVLFIGIYGNIGKYTWKGRIVK